MDNCKIRPFFDNSSDSKSQVAYTIACAYWDAKNKQKINKQKKFSTKDFYDRLIDLLKSKSTPFEVVYSSDLKDSQKKLYKESFNNLKQAIITLIPDSLKKDIKINELVEIINTQFQQDLDAGRLKIQIEDKAENFNIEQKGAIEDTNFNVKDLSLKQFLSNIYGGCFGAVNLMRNQFSRDIFMHSICDLKNGNIVTTNSELNSSIIDYKNELFSKIQKFVIKLNPDATYPDQIYTDSGLVHKGYYSVLQEMQKYLSQDNIDSIINDEYSLKLFDKSSEKLDAINAYTILKYFDSLLQETLGKTIKYNKLYKNTEVQLGLNKYEFSKDTAHQRKSWTDSENRTAIENSSRYIKFILDSIPFEINGKSSGRNIGLNRLYATWAKLITGVTKLSNSVNKDVDDLIEYILAFPGSTTFYACKIFKLISENDLVRKELKKLLKFTNDDLGVIQSMYKYVFSYDVDMNRKPYDEYQNKSIKSIEFNMLNSSYYLGKYSILSDIVGALDDCTASPYIYTEQGQDGGVITKIRQTYKDRRLSEKFKDTVSNNNFASSQSYKEKLQKECVITYDSNLSKEKVTVTVPSIISDSGEVFEFNITTGSLGILGQSSSTKLTSENSPILWKKIFDLFGEDSPIDLNLESQRNKLLSEDNIDLDENERLFRQVLEFIDKRLLTKFLSDDGLKKLNIYKELRINAGHSRYLEDLLLYSVKSQVVSNIYYEFNEKRLNPEDSSITSKKDFKKFLLKQYPAFANLNSQQQRTYFMNNNGITKLISIPSSTQWVDDYALATMILNGDLVSSVSKNQSKNNDANYVTQFLGGRIFSLCYESAQAKKERQQLIKENPFIPEIASGALLFTKHIGALKGYAINSDIKNRQGTVKAIRDLKSSELFYNAIIHNFWNSFLSTGEYCIQPTTYADKVKLIQYLVDGKNYKHFNKKSLSQLNKEEVINLYRETVGKASQLALDNVKYLYSKLWGIPNITLDQINDKLKTYTEEELVKEAQAKGLQVQLDLHYRIKNINGKESLGINEVLVQEAKYSDLDVLHRKFKTEEVNFINNLVDSGVFFYIDYHDTSLYDPEYKNLSNLEQLKRSTSPISNIIIELHNSGEIKDIDEWCKKWIRNGKLILAYDIDENPIIYKNTNNVSEINPILEKYFYIDTLVANNIRLQLTGFETNHPDRSDFKKLWGNIANGVGIENDLINNKYWKNEKGVIEATGNIDRLQKSKIIWGHPALGKTSYLEQHPGSIIDWDDVFNVDRNKFITEALGTDDVKARYQYLKEFYNYVRGDGEYNSDLIPIYEQYRNMIYLYWDKAKELATSQNKKLFASPTVLLELFGDEFDLILTMDTPTFLSRKPGGRDWKKSINKLLNKSDLVLKVINVGNLYMSDIMALNDSFDLYQLSNSSHEQISELAKRTTTIIENISQGTQLKRNVPIPGTIHGMHTDLIEGVSKKIKVACIKDVKADVYNFTGDKKKVDSMDGSARIVSFQSILENKTLGSQEVGWDKKPLWHHYNKDTGTSALMKFASFAINNETMLLSLESNISLLNMFKKMTNLQWSELNEFGHPENWKTTHPITLGTTIRLTGAKQVQQKLNFKRDILENQSLFYKTYDENGEVIYKQIEDFGGDSINGYYTIESYCNKYGDLIRSKPLSQKVYHYFDSKSTHHNIKQEGDHTINSLYELWLSLGGLYSQSKDISGILQNSESSHFAVVGFMNKTMFLKKGSNVDRFDISQRSYDQPLKDMYIGYLTNNSAMKNGAVNRNSDKRWYDDEELTYMEMDSKHLGIQMDADHDVETATTLTEPSQVVTALESGGSLHKYAKQVYKDLGRIAITASKIEVDTVVSFLAGMDQDYTKVKSDLYEVFGKILFNGIKSREDQANLSDELMKEIEKKFHKNISHLQDEFKIPVSDSNIYSQVLPTLVSLINQKSIKRKIMGAGCVMIPSYNIVQYFQIDGNQYLFSDLVPMALDYLKINNIKIEGVNPTASPEQFEKEAVKKYLNELQKDPKLIANVEDFIPSDLVDIILEDGTIKSISLDNLTDYYKFKDKDWTYFGIESIPVSFRHRITQPKNLAPSKITFYANGKKMNVFDLKPFKDAYKNPSLLNKEAVKQAFIDLHNGIIYEDSKRLNPIKITNLQNEPAENVISNMYRNQFGIGNKSVAQIRKEGIGAFKIKYKRPIQSKHYDISFSKTDDTSIYISFNSPKGSSENTHLPYKQSELHTETDKRGNINVWLMSDENRKLFKVGRYVLKEGYTYKSSFQDKENNLLSAEEALKEGHSYINNVFYNSFGHQVPKEDALKEGVIYNPVKFFNEEGEQVSSRRLKSYNSAVYEYVEFVSKYRVVEQTSDGDGIYSTQEYYKYYINIHNIRKTFQNETDSKINEELKSKFITGVLDEIYATDQFLGITINPELSEDSAANIMRYVSNIQNVDNNFRNFVLLPTEKELRKKFKELEAQRKDKKDYEKESFLIGDFLKEAYTKYYEQLAVERFSSWELSLYSTSARIPAQTLQSFMQMKTVGYSGNTQNKVYVSHWQIWLQGSDYEFQNLNLELLHKLK